MKLPKRHLYGAIADTGQLSIRSRAGYTTREGIIDPGEITLAVEVWTSVPINHQRGHCMEVMIPAPMSYAKYMDAYKRVVLTYSDFWRSCGAEPPKDWKEQLARSCGTAMSEFMKSSLVQMASTLN